MGQHITWLHLSDWHQVFSEWNPNTQVWIAVV
jgi:hypothetical protein